MKTRVLALDAYHGGSHKAFLDGWIQHSRHDFTKLTLPAYKWKWRMRHAAITFAEQVRAVPSCDVLFATDMLNLAEFLGLCPSTIRQLPSVVYFHENQLTYPDRESRERDLHFAFTNLTTALAATRVWFNSAYHRDEFLDALTAWIGRFPDFSPQYAPEAIRAKSEIHSPGIHPATFASSAGDNPLRIVWVSRWEHDKDPETFFAALYALADHGCDFRVSVLGEAFGQAPTIFAEARGRLGDRIERWGYLPTLDDYRQALADADVVVSTARHEFFGIGVLEAVEASCFPLVPHRLAYPETLGEHEAFYHDGTVAGLVRCLLELEERRNTGTIWPNDVDSAEIVSRYHWSRAAAAMDAALPESDKHEV